MVLNFADPDRKWRNYRIAAHLAAAAWSVAVFIRHPAPAIAAIFVAAAIFAALVIIYLRWLNGSHFRLYPLVFPLVCGALVWDGEWIPGVIGLVGSLVGFMTPLALASNVTSKGIHPAFVKRLRWLSADPSAP
jgi:nitrate/nitrite transporter NarK